MFIAGKALFEASFWGSAAGASDSWRAPRDERGRPPLIERAKASVTLC